MLGIPVSADSPSADAQAVADYLNQHAPMKTVLASEGEFVCCFNPAVEPWIEQPLTARRVRAIRETLEPHLTIGLNAQGFAPAATRTLEGEADETNYDAIWVRDNVWVYYALAANPQRAKDAKRLLLALWDYYATEAQVDRFRGVIEDPSRAQEAMLMPHIRFDGASVDLSDVSENGKPQVWNHRQIDAHGLFYIALGEAFLSGRVGATDLTPSRLKVLSLYPRFLESIEFHRYEDAGAWEEIPRQNTSSIALATRSLQVWKRLLYAEPNPVQEELRSYLLGAGGAIGKSWTEKALSSASELGLETVKRQLEWGGESPNYPPDDIHFRRADAALVVLIQPSPLEGLSEQEMRRVLTIVETLKRPQGVLRYLNDSYQGGNYWIRPPATEGPAATGDTSSREAFLWRLSQLPPDTEAQWFFDSLLAMARVHLAQTTTDSNLRAQDIHAAGLHIKRALGQLTGPGQIASDGKPVRPWQAPESINTVVIDGKKSFLASPITPLNWAKAGLDMALRDYQSLY